MVPTVREVEDWNKDRLLKFIQQKRPHILEDDDDLENFKKAKISGKFFLTLAGKTEFFEEKCHLPVGISGELAEVVKEITGAKTTIEQGKLLSFIPYSKH
jgi:hypothetical protein